MAVRYGKSYSKQVLQRAEFELGVIGASNFEDYILLCWDLYDFMRIVGIPYGPGRGSAAASIVCYALGITGICPLKYDLLFERFLNPERVSMPDLDMDVSAERRQEVIAYLKRRWGDDKVAQIVTFGTFGARASVRDMGRVMSIPLAVTDKLAKMIPKNGSVTTDREDRDYLNEALDTVKEFKALYTSDKDAKRVIDAAIQVEGIIHHLSIHAGGIVIADKPVTDYAPLITATKGDDSKDERLTAVAYGMNELEYLGLIKFDILGSKTIDVIDHTVGYLKEFKIVDADFSISDIPLDDPKTFILLGSGFTAGLFQVECVAGDTIVGGMNTTIEQLYLNPPATLKSVDLGNGSRPQNDILKIVASGEKQLYRITTRSGFTLRATGKHPILTANGWKEIDDITAGEQIVVNRRDNSRIGVCPNCNKQTKARASKCRKCTNISRDSAATMLKNRDYDSWLAGITRGPTHRWWGGHSPTTQLTFDDVPHKVASKWEADFARYLIATKTQYEYEPKTFHFSDGSGYTPDFYLPSQKLWIEVKGKSGLCGRGKKKVDRFKLEFPQEKIEVINAHQIAELELANPYLAKWSCPTLPEGFDFDEIASIAIDKIEMTYDICMAEPYNNYVANGILVHNSPGMAGWLRKMKPDHIEDIIAMLALYRPGPMAFIGDYIDRKHGKLKVEYPHKALKPVLESTYGVAVFQEQLMKIGQVIAGWSLARADQLRKVIGKKIVDKIAQERKDFADDAKKNGYDWKFADKLFEEFIEPAARYSFNRGHSASYAMITYQTAWLKANHPVCFFAALLANAAEAGDWHERTGRYIADARSLGIAVLPPDINVSELTFTPLPKEKAVIYGLSAIKNVGEKAVKMIIKNRQKKEFEDIFDFVERTKDRLVTSRTVESLVLAGAFDNLPGTRQDNYQSVGNAMDRTSMMAEDRDRIKATGKPVNRRKPIPEAELVEYERAIDAIDLDDPISLLASERELLGAYVSGHPFNEFKNEIAKLTSSSLQDAREKDPGSIITVCGIVSQIKLITTKKKSKMMTLVIEDDQVSLEVVVFPSQTSKFKDDIIIDYPLVVTGRLEGDEDSEHTAVPKLILSNCYSINDAPTVRKIQKPKSSNINRFFLSYSNYMNMIASAKSPAVFVLPNGDEYSV